MKQWTIVITAATPADLRDELMAAAGHVHMFPAMFVHADVDAEIEVTSNCNVSRAE